MHQSQRHNNNIYGCISHQMFEYIRVSSFCVGGRRERGKKHTLLFLSREMTIYTRTEDIHAQTVPCRIWELAKHRGSQRTPIAVGGLGSLLKGTSAVLRRWTGTFPATSPHYFFPSDRDMNQRPLGSQVFIFLIQPVLQHLFSPSVWNQSSVCFDWLAGRLCRDWSTP